MADSKNAELFSDYVVESIGTFSDNLSLSNAPEPEPTPPNEPTPFGMSGTSTGYGMGGAGELEQSALYNWLREFTHR